MLWAAAMLAFVAGMPQLTVAISLVVVVNAAFSFLQERRSDRAAERLNSLLPRRVIVRRNAALINVDGAEVVEGDVMVLAAGDRICADAELVINRGARIDTSMLTGESEPVGLDVGEPLFAGTFVVDGEAEGIVVATGTRTRLAQIAELTSAIRRPERPLTTELRRVVRSISVIAIMARRCKPRPERRSLPSCSARRRTRGHAAARRCRRGGWVGSAIGCCSSPQRSKWGSPSRA